MRNRKNQAVFAYWKRCAARRKPRRVKPNRRRNKTWDSEARKRLSQFFSFPCYLGVIEEPFGIWEDSPWRRAVHEYTGTVDFADSLRSRLFDSVTLPAEVLYREARVRHLGDVSCANNARSPYLQCAINPVGDCCNCPDFESKFK